jgi:membrane-bound serine protease (ClpP class)
MISFFKNEPPSRRWWPSPKLRARATGKKGPALSRVLAYAPLVKRTLLTLLLALLNLGAQGVSSKAPVVYVLPIRQEIGDPLLYLVRRGVKEAMQHHADILVLDMETNGGEIDAMLKIIDVLHEFKGKTVTFVNKTAFSAGALMAMATDEIYMAPESVIGAAAPVMLSPGGAGVESMPDTMERKITSAMNARMRAYAERYGHNPEVAEAMIDKSKVLKLDGQTLKCEGTLLTLTNHEAEKEYGAPPKPLLSLGTVSDLPALFQRLGSDQASVTRVESTGVEALADWILTIRPLLLMVGVIGIYMEFKMPGVVLPGVIGGAALAVYFFGGYVAGLSGLEWLALFIVGVALVAVELFVLPGSTAIGLAGSIAMFVALLMAMVDIYPGGPLLPTLPQLKLPLRDLSFALAGALVCVACLARFLPRTRFYGSFVSQTASGTRTVAKIEARQRSLHGLTGVTVSTLRPGGKAQFGDELVDVISDGEMVEAGKTVQVIGSSGDFPLVKVM